MKQSSWRGGEWCEVYDFHLWVQSYPNRVQSFRISVESEAFLVRPRGTGSILQSSLRSRFQEMLLYNSSPRGLRGINWVLSKRSGGLKLEIHLYFMYTASLAVLQMIAGLQKILRGSATNWMTTMISWAPVWIDWSKYKLRGFWTRAFSATVVGHTAKLTYMRELRIQWSETQIHPPSISWIETESRKLDTYLSHY